MYGEGSNIFQSTERVGYLVVEGEVCDIHLARGLKAHRRRPRYDAIVTHHGVDRHEAGRVVVRAATIESVYWYRRTSFAPNGISNAPRKSIICAKCANMPLLHGVC